MQVTTVWVCMAKTVRVCTGNSKKAPQLHSIMIAWVRCYIAPFIYTLFAADCTQANLAIQSIAESSVIILLGNANHIPPRIAFMCKYSCLCLLRMCHMERGKTGIPLPPFGHS